MQVISSVAPEEWDKILKQAGDFTFFQTYTWANILKRSFGFEIATRLYIFDDGTKVLLPLMKTFNKFGVFTEYVSMPIAYGGFVANPPINTRKIQKILRTFRSNEAVLIGPPPLSPIKCGDGVQKMDYYTHILWLDGDFDHTWNQKVKKKRRNRCRKAEKMGVIIVEDCSLEAFKEYYSIYRNTSLARGQKNIYPKSFFEEMAHSQSENIKLWLAKLGEKTIAGSIVFYNEDNLFNWSEATVDEFTHYHPASALVKHIIEDACNRGFKYIDFGGSIGADGQELAGVRFHKESFGAEKVEYSAYRWEGKFFYFARSISHLTKKMRFPKME